MSTVNSNIQIGKKDAAFFAANPTLVLLDGQLIYNEDTGDLFIGDGVTQLNALVAINGGGGGVWGSITGTLSNQTDLQNALNAKLNASEKSTSADQVVITNGSNVLTSLSLGASQSIRRNAANNAFEAYTPSSGGQGVQDYNSPLAWFHQLGFGGVRVNAVITLNSIYYAPIYFSVARTITDVGAFSFAAIAGNQIRIGMYSNVNERPSALLFDSGAISSATQGFKQAVQSYTFAPGMYWMAFICSANSSWACAQPLLMFDDPTTGALLIGNAFTQAFTFGALPATATPVQANVPSMPLIYMKNA